MSGEQDDRPECDLCGKTSCPDADLPGFSEPRDCALKPVYDELRYDRCEYGCGRDITKASIRIAVRTLADLTIPPGQPTPPDERDYEGRPIGEDGLVEGPGGQRLKPVEDPWPGINAQRQQDGGA